MFQIHFHGRNYDSLLKHIDEKYLPKKYGGKMENLQFDRMELYEILLKYQDDFESKWSKAVANRHFLYLCCMDGTFRWESVDTAFCLTVIPSLYIHYVVGQF